MEMVIGLCSLALVIVISCRTIAICIVIGDLTKAVESLKNKEED